MKKKKLLQNQTVLLRYKARKNFTVDEWKQVLWNDETRFSLYQLDGRVRVWRIPGEHLLPECIVPIVKLVGVELWSGDVSRGMDWDF